MSFKDGNTGFEQRYAQWMAHADGATQAELAALTRAEVEERFYTELSFGTAGIRGLIGAGTNRINAYVVRRATQGLCDCLKQAAVDGGVAIAYDSRRFSAEFALETALVLAQNGIRAYLFDSLRTVPQLSFTLRHLGCAAGVMITASHNPAAYNGYKVYWSHGGQLGPLEADAVYEAMRGRDYFSITPMDKSEALEKGLLVMIGEKEDEAYYAAAKTLLIDPALLSDYGDTLRVVYTPLHGAGNIPVRTLLSRVGVKNVHVVRAQEAPDPDFPTVRAPNPEDPDAFTLAIALANEVGADNLIATDPDSDRLGLSARNEDGAFNVFTGNQIGCLLLDYILGALNRAQKLPQNAIVVKSVVSTPLADAICARYNVRIADVPTGFRFISEIIDTSARTGESTFLFGFEQSYGFLAGGYSRDKDAISSAMLLMEALTYHARHGKTAFGALDELDAQYGCFREAEKAYTLTGKAGMEKIAACMRALRETPIRELGGKQTLSVEDALAGLRTSLHDGSTTPAAFDGVDMLRYFLEDGAWMVVRPSGTEPKLKLYVGVRAGASAEAEALLGGLLAAADGVLERLGVGD